VRGMQSIRAISCPAHLQERLSVKSRTPLLFFERVSFSQQNIPIILRIKLLFFWQDFVGQDGILSYRPMHLWCAKEYLKAYYRANRYSLHNDLSEAENEEEIGF